MTEILVRHCDVRIMRHGGWSWGPEPRELLDGMLAALPGLIAAELGGLALPAGGGPVEITRPIRVTVPVTAAELAELVPGHTAGGAPGPVPGHGTVRQAVAAAITTKSGPAAGGDRPVGGGDGPLGDGDGPVGGGGGSPPVEAPSDPQAALVRLLAAVHRAGFLTAYLAALPAPVVAAWCRELQIHRAVSVAAPPLVAIDIAEALAIRMAAGPLPAPPGDGSLPAAGIPAGPVAPERRDPARAAHPAALPTGLAGPAVGPGDAPAAPPERQPSALLPDTDTGGQPSPVAGQAVPAAVQATREPAEAAALPYLLLGPLSELGFLDAVAAAFGLAGEDERLPALAAALAYKVLQPPERGWRRAPEDHQRAALFAGRAEPVPEPAIVDLAGRAVALLGPGIAVVATAVAAARPGAPVVVHEPEAGGVLAAAAADLCPIAWDEPARVAALLAARDRPPVFVGPGGAALATFAALRRVELSHATDVPPVRGEPGRRVRGRPGLWGVGSRRAVARAAAQADRAAMLPDVVAALAARPAAPLGPDPTLDRALSVAAGAALTALASRLWGGTEPVDANLTFERMGDLDARVRMEPQRVRVLLPLGRRRADLFAAGLMRDVPGVPWLGGRVLEFGGG